MTYTPYRYTGFKCILNIAGDRVKINFSLKTFVRTRTNVIVHKRHVRMEEIMDGRRQVVITKIQGKKTLLYLENDKIYDVIAEPEDSTAPALGNIYVGKIKNIVANINAAFVEVKSGILCYLPLSECGQDQALRPGDEIIVQIKKAAVKTKQAVATRFPELVGNYCVVSTAPAVASATFGISKKITDSRVLDRLSEIKKKFEGSPYGIVLRTAAQYAEPETIEQECEKLIAELQETMEHGKFLSCFSLIREETPFYLRYLYGCREEDLERIITDDPSVYHTLQSEYNGSKEKLCLYEDETFSLDKLLGISSKLKKALEKRVWLKSGGNLVIEPTEALTVIDVNTGKAIEGKRQMETTFFRINCEAAKEVARQIRMRGISGMILVDFIDLKDKNHQRELMSILRSELQKDRVKTILVDITKLGLVEITRMKIHPPLWETFSKEIL